MADESAGGTSGDTAPITPPALTSGGGTGPTVPPASGPSNTSGVPPADSSAKPPPKKRGRKPRVVDQAEALATSPGPGGKCVDPDCPKHGEGRAPRKCIETGEDIWPRMSPSEAVTLAREGLRSVNLVIGMLSGERVSPPTDDDAVGASHAVREIVHKRMGSISRYSDVVAFVLAIGAYAQVKMAEAKTAQKKREREEKNAPK